MTHPKAHIMKNSTRGHAAATAPATAPVLQTMEQSRARYALTCIQEVKGATEKEREAVLRQANRLPALVRMNGLGQAMAFFRTKGAGEGHDKLYRWVSHWLCRSTQDGKTQKGCIFEMDDILDGITHASMRDYMHAQAEALALLEWVQKFARAFLKTPEAPKKEPVPGHGE